MTKQAHGDEAGALTNAVLGNILGVFISPILIFTYVGNSLSKASLNYGETFLTLAETVILPLIVGQLIQVFAPKFVEALSRKVSLPIVNSCLLLILVWAVFCNTFSQNIAGGLDAASFVGVLFICLALFLCFSALSFGIARALRFSRPETV
jgi:solute carrier family 10 (sodium/bile acid cotransporter), member 7